MTQIQPSAEPRAALPDLRPYMISAGAEVDAEAELLNELFHTGSAIEEPPVLLRHFGVWFGEKRPSDLFVSLSRRNMPADRFKITRWMTMEDRRHLSDLPAPNPWRDWQGLHALEGGLFGAVVASDRPLLLAGLDTSDDPHLREYAGRIRSAIAVPSWDDGEALNWAVWLFEAEEPPYKGDFADMVLQMSLMGMSTKNLVVKRRVQELNERLSGQLEQIANIQKSLLPQKLPKIPRMELAVSYLTSTEAGGDYYDFFPFPGGKWGILIADVAGHGAGAATVMAMLRAILHCYDREDICPDQVMEFANAKLLGANLEGSFVTAFFAVLDPETGHLCWVRCGHNPPRLKRGGHGGAVAPLEDGATLPLGVMSPLEVESAEITLQSGDTVILYTDGITEAFDTGREMFGEVRLDESLVACSGAPECVVDSVHSALYRHTGVMDRDDDQTLLAMRYLPAGA